MKITTYKLLGTQFAVMKVLDSHNVFKCGYMAQGRTNIEVISKVFALYFADSLTA